MNRNNEFERKTERNRFGPNKQRDGSWRTKTNTKFDRLLKQQKYTNNNEIKMIARLGYLERM